jgi:hypothetical protein
MSGKLRRCVRRDNPLRMQQGVSHSATTLRLEASPVTNGDDVVARWREIDQVGPAYLFTPFPVGTTIVVVFAHREGGAGAVVAVCRGFIPGLFSFCTFCAALSWGLRRGGGGIAAPFAVALLISLLVQGVCCCSSGEGEAFHDGA